MKLLKLFVFAMMALVAVACSDDDNINSTDATVSMGLQEYVTKENKGIFTIPVEVTGKRDGDVFVDVDINATDSECKEDVHYIITSKHVVIPANKNSVNIEIKTIDDHEINEDRKFTLVIQRVIGGQVNADKATTEITLRDNDDIPYERMAGTWTVTANNGFMEEGHNTVSWDVQLSTVIDDDAEGYGSKITMSPWMMWDGTIFDFTSIDLNFHYNNQSQTASIELPLGFVMADGIEMAGDDPSLDYSSCSIISATPGMSSFTTSGTLVGTVNEELNSVSFNLPVVGILRDANNVMFSQMFWYTNFTMKKKN